MVKSNYPSQSERDGHDQLALFAQGKNFGDHGFRFFNLKLLIKEFYIGRKKHESG